MHIFLLNPSFLSQYGKFSREQRSPAITKSGTLYYPMWLSYATGVLEKNDFHTTLFDCPADNIQISDIELFIRNHKPRLVVIDTSTPSIYADMQMGGIIKSINPDTFIVLVGPHVSALPEDTLNCSQDVDAVAIHEYEYTLLDLAHALKNGTDWRGIPGLCYQVNGKIIRNPRENLLRIWTPYLL